ncbi:MAG TPA: cytochrome C [Chryseolinea sp.]|nr:cytochrome C [Chryseolinea sp.]HPM32464.1 cytochrome C [Chryseolinea sp.]
MKKVFVVIAIASFATFTITSCGSKKEAEQTEATAKEADSDDENELAEPKKESPDEMIAQGQALVDGSDCKTCHHPTNKIIGPSHTEVATKYEFTKANVTMLAGKIINGGSGNWGEIPMSPHGDLTLADAEKMSMYVLSLDGEKPKD